jgi:hypothetical protein
MVAAQALANARNMYGEFERHQISTKGPGQEIQREGRRKANPGEVEIEAGDETLARELGSMWNVPNLISSPCAELTLHAKHIILQYTPSTTSNILTFAIFVYYSLVSLLACVYEMFQYTSCPPFVFFCIPQQASLYSTFFLEN